MNLLAHAVLSFGNKDILTGNMISDFIKGKKQYDLSPMIYAGLLLHRAIDAFTDAHDATREMKKFFAPHYRLYSGAFADVSYDYFLANDPAEFLTEKKLLQFSSQCYAQLAENADALGEAFGAMFPYMREQNWLYNYRLLSGIEKSFKGVQRRSRYIQESETAMIIFMENIGEMQPLYNSFYPDVKKFAKQKLGEIINSLGLSLV